jgi:hypothetical protein
MGRVTAAASSHRGRSTQGRGTFGSAHPVVRNRGASGSWLFWCPEHDLYLAGPIDQTTAAGVPYRLLPKVVRQLGG